MLTDSLIIHVEFDENYNYSFLIQENIKLALEIDSLGMATKHTADFIYYHSHILGNPTKGLEVFSEFEEEVKRSRDYNANPNLYIYASDWYTFLKDLKTALEVLYTAKEYAEKAESKSRIATILVRIGYVKLEMGQFAEASQNIQEARKYFIELKDTINILGANNGLSILYSQNKFYKEAQQANIALLDQKKT